MEIRSLGRGERLDWKRDSLLHCGLISTIYFRNEVLVRPRPPNSRRVVVLSLCIKQASALSRKVDASVDRAGSGLDVASGKVEISERVARREGLPPHGPKGVRWEYLRDRTRSEILPPRCTTTFRDRVLALDLTLTHEQSENQQTARQALPLMGRGSCPLDDPRGPILLCVGVPPRG